MRKQQDNGLMVEEIAVRSGKRVALLTSDEGVLCFRQRESYPWEPCGEQNIPLAQALNRWVIGR